VSESGGDIDDVRIEADNVGGIDETAVVLESGVNVLTGRNATNRTSLLQALMAALGSDDVTLKGSAESGLARLTIGDETYERHLQRQNGNLVLEGDPYLDDSTIADLFAFLLEDNPIRRAIERGEGLRTHLLEPIDVDAIEDRIERLETECDEIDAELEEVKAARARLDELRPRRSELDGEIETLEADLDAVREDLADLDVDEIVGTSGIGDAVDELEDRQSELENVRFQLETERESLGSLRSQRRRLENRLDDQPTAVDSERRELETELDRLRRRKRRLDTAANTLGSIVEEHRSLLDESGTILRELLDGVDVEGADGRDRSGPVDGDSHCLLCGRAIDRSTLETELDRLEAAAQEARFQRGTLDEEIDAIQDRLAEIEDVQAERTAIEDDLDRVKDEIAIREERVADLERDREDLEAEIETIEGRIADTEAEGADALVSRYERSNELEFELGRLRENRASVVEEIEELESRVADESSLRDRRETIEDDLTEARTRVDRLEREAVEAFDEHVNALFDRLEYENIERVWIERIDNDDAGQGASDFRINVARRDAAGEVYEDRLEHLSESEREVIGLVFALAGYLVHDVHERVPFMLLDSLEAIDAERIATLVEYFEDFVPYVVVALLEDDARPLDEGYRYVREI
jgi:predicted  nucleic acid-binding Zn-ribbon protein